jgi:hypothetical protein
MHPLKKALGLCAVLASAPAAAVTLRADSQVGLMQQPTCHYYHLTYGGQFSLATDSQSVIWRAAYTERPAFKSMGYEDKDYGVFTTLGTKITKSSKDSGVVAAIGVGSVQGYIKSDSRAAGIVKNERRSYSLVGPTVSLDYEGHLGPVQWSIGHQTFVGFVDRSEVEAYVAWPYNFFQTSLGVAW